jgi:hypothetical protein
VAGTGRRAAHRIWKENMCMSGKTDEAISGDEGRAWRGKEGAARETLAGLISIRLYNITSQKIVLFIVTAKRTSNL